MTNKIRVGILFGGKSAEHEVSLQSAKNVIDAIDRDKYDVVLIGLDKSGRWHLNDSSEFLLNSSDPKLIRLGEVLNDVALAPESGGELSALSGDIAETAVDVVFPVLHGPYGEDGTVQGLLKLANIPFVGAGVLGSAVGMDKDVMKRLLRDAGVPIGNFITLRMSDEVPGWDLVTEELGSPVFVKPANMGSSVGVSKVDTGDDYLQAVRAAFEYDTKILIEEYIAGREIECSVLGNESPIASVPGEILPTHDFYSYEAKYIDENGARLKIPAELSPQESEKVRALSVRTFEVLCCEGLARVDIFLNADGEFVVNEINTIPGFTSISMYPMLWKASGISYTELIDRLLELAMARHKREQGLKTTFT
jgi:D-alanine-D-alanine ligase